MAKTLDQMMKEARTAPVSGINVSKPGYPVSDTDSSQSISTEKDLRHRENFNLIVNAAVAASNRAEEA